MHLANRFLLSAVFASAMTVGSPAGNAWGAESFKDPGQTWRNNGLNFGENIRLLKNGRYLAQNWCDICMPLKITHGSWKRLGEEFTLTPDGKDVASRTFKLMKVGDCTALVPPNAIEADGVNGFEIYVREGDNCSPFPHVDCAKQTTADLSQPTSAVLRNSRRCSAL